MKIKENKYIESNKELVLLIIISVHQTTEPVGSTGMMVLYPALRSWRQDDEGLRAIPDYIVRPRLPWDIELCQKNGC